MAVAAAIFCGGSAAGCIETNAQTIPKEVAARVEIHAIPSLTLSDQQFLTGDGNGKPVTMAGEFRIAQGIGKLPAVVLMHGSGGVARPWRPGRASSTRWGFRPSSSTAFPGAA